MPELPEVEVVRAGLEPATTGATVTAVTVLDERSLRRHPGPAEDFVERLTGATLLTPARRGKFLWIALAGQPSLPSTSSGTETGHPSLPSTCSGNETAQPSLPSTSSGNATGQPSLPSTSSGNGTAQPPVPEQTPVPELVEGGVGNPSNRRTSATALVVHLGMSGQVLLREPGAEDALTRIRIELRHPVHGPLRLNFVDQRIFGSMAIDDLLPATDAPSQSIPSQVSHIARDPIDPLFDERLFLRRLATRRSGIKRALLDQALISGIGNIYADESLWAARIHGEQPANTLSRPRAKTLLAEVRAVLARALAEGGTSFDTQYLNVNGESGYFAHSLQAYGQHGRPCPRCGRPMVREAFMNRNSHFCPHCQRLRASAAR